MNADAGPFDAASAATVYDAFATAARRWPRRPLLCVLPETAAIYGVDAGEIGYGDALVRVDALAAALAGAGYRSGQRVLLLLENRPAFFFYWLALNRLGLSAVPVNPDLRAGELEYLIGHAEPALAIALPQRAAALAEAARAAGRPLPLTAPDDAPPACPHAAPTPCRARPSDASETSFATPARAVDPPAAAVDPPAAPGAREAALLYTSGTTGLPKGCVLSNEYFLLAGRWYRGAGGVCALSDDGERMITPLPLFHMNAMAYSFMAMLAVGGCLICLDRFHPRSWWRSVRAARASCLHYLGVMPPLLMAAGPAADERCERVRFGFGAGVDPTLHAEFEQRFGFPLVEAWAMTETGAGAVIAANREPRRVGARCFGRPEPPVEARIADEQGRDVPAGTPGELLVRRAGPDPRRGFFTEYYKDPQATARAWRGGWFHTGDVVCAEADGSMIFVDRKKNVIRRSGENIAAVEVEAVLVKHPAVATAGVAAVPDPLRGDEVFACLQLADGATPGPALAEDIVGWCLERLAYYKAPGYVAFVDALPLTSTQKVQRGELKALAAALLDDAATCRTAALKKRQTA